MNTLRLYAFLSCFALLIQPSVAQEPPADPPPLDVTALCAESPALCVLAQRVQQIENVQQLETAQQADDKTTTEPICYYLGVYLGLWCVGDPQPECPWGTLPQGDDCVAVTVKAFDAASSTFIDTTAIDPAAIGAVGIDTTDPTYHWPRWWPKPWNIPRPPYPYPWQFGPLPDPWLELALQQRLGVALPNPTGMALPWTGQRASPVLIDTDKGAETIPDFCLLTKWPEGQMPPECSGLVGLVRKLGLSPEDAPLLQAAP